MKILTVIGARPQFIKAAVISREFKKFSEIQEVLVHTGQHYDDNMSAIFFRELGMEAPAYDLGIRSEDPSSKVADMVKAITPLLSVEKPDCVLVYGDTYSTLAGALAAGLNKISLAHVEAGLRHGDMSIPEEFNRVLTDRISKFLFCPTHQSVENLRQEGLAVEGTYVELTGDVMFDAALYFDSHEGNKRQFTIELPEQFILCTLHRAENTDDPSRLSALLKALDEVNENVPVILPLHPRTRKRMDEFGLATKVQLLEPLGYPDTIHLLKKCRLVMTDSGGLQKEAYFFGKHVVVLREQTEWHELTEHGYACLAGSDPKEILKMVNLMLMKHGDFSERFYGDGKAGERIAGILLEAFSGVKKYSRI